MDIRSAQTTMQNIIKATRQPILAQLKKATTSSKPKTTATKTTSAKKAATTKAKSTTAKKATTTKSTSSTAKSESLSSLAGKVKSGNVSGDSIINQFKDKIPDDQMNMIKLQQSLEQRSQAVNMVTNLLRTIHEMSMSVVRNFRVA